QHGAVAVAGGGGAAHQQAGAVGGRRPRLDRHHPGLGQPLWPVEAGGGAGEPILLFEIAPGGEGPRRSATHGGTAEERRAGDRALDNDAEGPRPPIETERQVVKAGSYHRRSLAVTMASPRINQAPRRRQAVACRSPSIIKKRK